MGVWVEGLWKIGVIGVKVFFGSIIFYGLVFNINFDLVYFDYIVLCGIWDKEVILLRKEIFFVVLDVEEVMEQLIQSLVK